MNATHNNYNWMNEWRHMKTIHNNDNWMSKWRNMKTIHNNYNWMNKEKWKQLIIITIEWMMLFSAGYATDELHVMDFLETIRGSGGRTNKYRCQLCTLESHDRSNMRRLGFSFSKVKLGLGFCLWSHQQIPMPALHPWVARSKQHEKVRVQFSFKDQVKVRS
jgi:hypothetical protein